MEELRREKDFFVKVLEDFEEQKAQHYNLLNSQPLRDQMRDLASWHRDIAQREKDLAILHDICVYAAHNQVIKRRYADMNAITLADPPRKP